FLAKFQELANESGIGQEDLILIFSNALKPKFALEVQIREPKTIEEAYKIAIKFEKNLGFIKANYVRLGNSFENEGNSSSEEEKANVVSFLAESNNLLMTVGFIDKKEVNKIVFEIGPTMSIIAEKCAIKNGITYKADSTQVRLADESLVKVCGKTEPLEVALGGLYVN
ncbi:unnamed protein product, partial [Brachionus calyciflorus]